mgnify:CR=1 FL=1
MIKPKLRTIPTRPLAQFTREQTPFSLNPETTTIVNHISLRSAALHPGKLDNWTGTKYQTSLRTLESITKRMKSTTIGTSKSNKKTLHFWAHLAGFRATGLIYQVLGLTTSRKYLKTEGVSRPKEEQCTVHSKNISTSKITI